MTDSSLLPACFWDESDLARRRCPGRRPWRRAATCGWAHNQDLCTKESPLHHLIFTTKVIKVIFTLSDATLWRGCLLQRSCQAGRSRRGGSFSSRQLEMTYVVVHTYVIHCSIYNREQMYMYIIVYSITTSNALPLLPNPSPVMNHNRESADVLFRMILCVCFSLKRVRLEGLVSSVQ